MAKLMVDGMEVGGTFTSGESGSTNASDHIYDNTNSENITSENVQGAIDELDKRISEQITLGKINSDHRLLESVDFNDILEVGQYYVSSDEVAATCVNIPEPVAGNVFVTDPTNVHSEMGGTQVAYRVQYYNTYTNNVYSRDVVWNTTDTTFGEWRKVINSSDLDEVSTPYTVYDGLNDLGIPADGTASTTTVLNAMAAHSILITQNNVDLMLSDLPTTDGLLMIIKYGTSRNYAEITNQDGIKYFKSSNLKKWEDRDWQVVANMSAVYGFTGTNLSGTGIDLNNCISPGKYTISASSTASNGVNFPCTNGGYLEVIVRSTALQVWQYYHSFNGQHWMRTYVYVANDGSYWTNWTKIATNADLDTLSSNLNVKVESFDESTATLYLVPVK